MRATQLFFAPGTSEPMQKLAQAIPPYDLLKAYRDATVAFNTTDVVLILAVKDEQVEGFVAKPRSSYVEEAFVRWSPVQRAMHPLARESAHKKTNLPKETPAFWLVIESEEKGAMLCCAIGSYLQDQEETTSSGAS
jgi:hypothetical protein